MSRQAGLVIGMLFLAHAAAAQYTQPGGGLVGNGQFAFPGVMSDEHPSPPPPASYTQAKDRDLWSAPQACPTYDGVPGLAVDVNGNPFITNIQLFLDTCPQRDPNLAQILSDFQIRKDGVLVTNFPCSEPVSQIPVAQYPDELIYLQVLRAMYYMDRGQSGHLPWTVGTLYTWMKSKIGGVNIVTGVAGGYCCTTINGRVFFVGGTHDDSNREFDKTWDGISNVMAFAAHERRHLDGDGFPHSSCCGISGGCDDNFDSGNLSPYGVQWWLEKDWLDGDINVGVGCLSQNLIAQDAQWHLGGANDQYRSRFCYTKPPILTIPATPGGPCNARQCMWPAVWVPVASHNSGLNQSQWRSDLGLFNTGTATANVQLSFYGSGGVVTSTTHVPAGAQSILTDVVGQLGGSGSGAIQVLSDQPLKVTARSYNQVSSSASCYPNGTQGQDYPVLTASGGLSAGQSAYLAGLSENASYHCNIGVVDVGPGAATVLVELFNGAGSKLTSYTVSLTEGQWAQETQPFKNRAGQTAMDRGYAKVTVQSGSGVFGFASVIDNITNDPTTVVMQQ